MGITNFTVLLQSNGVRPTSTLQHPFDSILIDIQSVIHVSLSQSQKSNREDLLQDTCVDVVRWLREQIFQLLTDQKHTSDVTVILCFDGSGVPMKWAVQADRRHKKKDDSEPSDKEIIRNALFEHNSTSFKIFSYLENDIRLNRERWLLPRHAYSSMHFVLCSSESAGEGEHKLFQLAPVFGCRQPLVLSIDNDVFMIALMRRDRFQHVQIEKSFHVFYSLPQLIDSYSNVEVMMAVSFLFGNDFIPEIVCVRKENAEAIHEAIEEIDRLFTWECAPRIMHEFLKRMRSRLRFTSSSDYRDELLVEFWKNCMWMRDYYTRRTFPQKFMRNRLWGLFDRDRFLTAAIEDEECLERTFEVARSQYAGIVTKSPQDVDEKLELIFGEKKGRIEPFLLPSGELESHVISEFWWKVCE